MEQQKVKKITVGFVLGWLAGLFVLTMSLPAYTMGSLVMGTIVILCGLAIIPYFSNLIAEKFKFQISGGIKFVLVVVAMVLNFSAMSSAVSDRLDIATETGGEVTDNSIANDKMSTSTKELVQKVGCPNIVKEAKSYNIHWGESDGGHSNLYLAPSFILEMQFSDDFTLYNKRIQ